MKDVAISANPFFGGSVCLRWMNVIPPNQLSPFTQLGHRSILGLLAVAASFLLQEATHAQSTSTGTWDPATPPTDVDIIIILYTPRSLAAQGDEQSLRDSIQAVVDSANYSYAKSLLGVRLNPVLIGLHNTWVESGNMLTDMRAMYSDARIATLLKRSASA